jgi:hypothetical protein
VRQSALKRNREQAVESRIAVAGGAEEHLFAIRSPAHNVIDSRMMGQPPGYSAPCGNHVDVDIAVVVARVRDHAPVGRKNGIALGSRAAGQQPSLAAIPWDEPEISGVSKRDMRFGQSGFLQQERTTGMQADAAEQHHDDESRLRKESLHGSTTRGGVTSKNEAAKVSSNSEERAIFV